MKKINFFRNSTIHYIATNSSCLKTKFNCTKKFMTIRNNPVKIKDTESSQIKNDAILILETC